MLGGDMGPWPRQPLPLWPLHCTRLGCERSWGGGAQIEVSHLYNNSLLSRRPKMAEHWLVFSYVRTSKRTVVYYWFMMRRRKSRRSDLRMSRGIGRSGEIDVPSDRNRTSRRLTDSLLFLSCSSPGHLKHPPMLSVRPPAGPPGYKCSLLPHFSEAIIEWGLRQGRQWMDSLVPAPWGSSSSE